MIDLDLDVGVDLDVDHAQAPSAFRKIDVHQFEVRLVPLAAQICDTGPGPGPGPVISGSQASPQTLSQMGKQQFTQQFLTPMSGPVGPAARPQQGVDEAAWEQNALGNADAFGDVTHHGLQAANLRAACL